MEQIMNYVKPELIVVAVVLYFVGRGLKKAQAVKDKYIPLILGCVGIVLCAIFKAIEDFSHDLDAGRTFRRNGNAYRRDGDFV